VGIAVEIYNTYRHMQDVLERGYNPIIAHTVTHYIDFSDTMPGLTAIILFRAMAVIFYPYQ